jgi:hypothetical protein
VERDESLSGERIKHLEFIQAIVTRLSGNSFLIKGWAITVAAAFYAYVATHLNWRVALVALLPSCAFWYLDSYFLWLERLFRCLYNDVRKAEVATEPFSMDTRPYRSTGTLIKAASSPAIWPLYCMVLSVGLILLIASVV